MGSFQISKNGYYMYKPSWQQEPGSRMRAANRAASDAYYAKFAATGTNLLGGMNTATANSVELTMKIATQRVQSDYQAKLKSAMGSMSTAGSALDLNV
jgi:hypothetical protein